ncbi:hypothetical protein BASA50_007864 [Batrachochytrium salamandrivorans]|uniref:GATA-type domain-containing protein n=1 Tax=Batrachochytrium salamandrivorans TaxID=1357716 RepID=A0ABQ8F5X2_9FUNG|nr:hypothetical protein BASA50_007864 [Batrachochytrium salamandrivorans]KAH9272658.1 hypothetical protein BASA83_005164 [Batrachochytrium salamandrivorans]
MAPIVLRVHTSTSASITGGSYSNTSDTSRVRVSHNYSNSDDTGFAIVDASAGSDFSAFAGIDNGEDLARSWRACTKVGDILENGSRFENLSWRLWHQSRALEMTKRTGPLGFKRLSFEATRKLSSVGIPLLRPSRFVQAQGLAALSHDLFGARSELINPSMPSLSPAKGQTTTETIQVEAPHSVADPPSCVLCQEQRSLKVLEASTPQLEKEGRLISSLGSIDDAPLLGASATQLLALKDRWPQKSQHMSWHPEIVHQSSNRHSAFQTSLVTEARFDPLEPNLSDGSFTMNLSSRGDRNHSLSIGNSHPFLDPNAGLELDLPCHQWIAPKIPTLNMETHDTLLMDFQNQNMLLPLGSQQQIFSKDTSWSPGPINFDYSSHLLQSSLPQDPLGVFGLPPPPYVASHLACREELTQARTSQLPHLNPLDIIQEDLHLSTCNGPILAISVPPLHFDALSDISHSPMQRGSYRKLEKEISKAIPIRSDVAVIDQSGSQLRALPSTLSSISTLWSCNDAQQLCDSPMEKWAKPGSTSSQTNALPLSKTGTDSMAQSSLSHVNTNAHPSTIDSEKLSCFKAIRVAPSKRPVAHGSKSSCSGKSLVCSNCGTTSTPLWRRSNDDLLLCNACGLYFKLHCTHRPKNICFAGQRKEEGDFAIKCINCLTQRTPLWRRDANNNSLCNACGLYFKLHKTKRPLSLKSDSIKKRTRADSLHIGLSGKDDSPPLV